MQKAYNFKKTEKEWCKIWKENELFRADNQSTATHFSMILPLPNVSDPLYMGDALTYTTADIITRRKKMQGFNTLWLPGLDHAGISTRRRELLSQLGLALDLDRMKSTPGKEAAKAVSKIFVHLHHQGEIYQSGPAKQWFLKTSGTAKPAVEAVQKGEITFIPGQWARVYFNRMRHLGDWCISRQSGWGHPIPAYYCSQCHHLMVEEEPPGKCGKCGSPGIEPDPAVLDAWFSTVLCPFTTLGWQDNSRDFATFYPTSLMAAGVDIIFLLAAYTIMLGLHLGKDVPFREVLISGSIRDEKGQKMSKTKNNIIDPADVIEKYGADPLRFTLAIQAVPGMDISLSLHRVNGYKAFTNKTWNASRYVIMNLKGHEDFNIDFNNLTAADKWVLHALNKTIVKVNDFMDNYRLNEAADLLYHFFWHEYCDWYLEFSKNDLHNPDTRKTLKFTLFKLLQLLHPFMPFITEELYQKIKGDGKAFLLQTEFPAFDSELVFNHEFTDMEALKKVVMETRKARAENKIDPNHRIRVYLKTESQKESTALAANMKYFDFLTRSARTEIVTDFSSLSKGFRGACLNWEILLPFDNDEDRLKELARLKKELEKIEKRITPMEKKLSNDKFVNKAPGSEVLNLKKNLQENIDKQNKIQKTINDLS
ncbi:MAG: class I tRNA ligase family protein [Candidatus Aminicenantes bacterium]|nr:MAG: class I tRNA ligase family protein [Candidatus Aminicenantes bacterium]